MTDKGTHRFIASDWKSQIAETLFYAQEITLYSATGNINDSGAAIKQR